MAPPVPPVVETASLYANVESSTTVPSPAMHIAPPIRALVFVNVEPVMFASLPATYIAPPRWSPFTSTLQLSKPQSIT